MQEVFQYRCWEIRDSSGHVWYRAYDKAGVREHVRYLRAAHGDDFDYPLSIVVIDTTEKSYPTDNI
jgi:hypothetical protein